MEEHLIRVTYLNTGNCKFIPLWSRVVLKGYCLVGDLKLAVDHHHQVDQISEGGSIRAAAKDSLVSRHCVQHCDEFLHGK